ncbi:hypothetical protein BJ165DRAFT_1114888 [Panaeolus papilionaceus]|nr:hypothetical protein BJ165DRAFT_1114888 [Panaeolus papilionaceus]
MALHPLPTELIYSILNHISSLDDLLNVAMSCRAFNDISLDIIFRRSGLDPMSPTLLLNIDTDNVACLPALCMWLQMHRNHKLQRLDFRYGRYPDLKGIGPIYKDLKLLRSYITKLGSVDEVNLALVAPTEATTPDLGEATVELLRAILERGCVSLHVLTTRLVDTRSQVEGAVVIHSDGLFFDSPTNWVWRKVHAGRVSQNQNGQLKKCTIYTYPPFLRQFYYDALQSNSTTLTEISFHRVFDGEEDWEKMMTALRLPHLKCLRIHVCVILQDPLIKFLFYHRNLTIFQYHHIRYHVDPPQGASRLSPTSFQSLEEIITTPRHLVHFLPPASKLPRLRAITIKVEVHQPDFSAPEEALATLRGCTDPIDLTLHITAAGLGIEAWMQTIESLPGGVIGDSEQRPERFLFAIRSLTLYNGSWGWNVGLLTRVMRWVSLFPTLEGVTFDAHPSSANVIRLNAEGEDALLRDFRRACSKRIRVMIRTPAREINLTLM